MRPRVARTRRRAAGALAIPTDVADPEAVEAAADRVEAELGPIDVWINNAMTTMFAPVVEIHADEFGARRIVTYLGSVFGTQSALRRMLPRNHGKIVQVGSALADRGIPLQSAYCGAKHAICGFLDAVRAELLPQGSDVHVTAVDMSALTTPAVRLVPQPVPHRGRPVPANYQPEVAPRHRWGRPASEKMKRETGEDASHGTTASVL